MENRQRVVCSENEGLAAFMWDKWQELAQKPEGISENLNNTMYKAYSNLCNSKEAVKSLKDLAQIKGVGKWLLKLMQGFFSTDSGNSESENAPKKGKRDKGMKRYVPQKNSVAYALLITLYRRTVNGSEFMRKQELIDAAEASGLSRASIAPEKGKGKPGQYGSSPQDWYSGWSCMKTLIVKGLVVKSSCPAKYMLTEEGKEAARDCLLRSGLVDPSGKSETLQTFPIKDQGNTLDSDSTKEDISVIGSQSDAAKLVALPSSHLTSMKKQNDISPEYLDRFLSMRFSREKIICAFNEVSETSQNKDVSSIWPAVLCCLREDQIYGQSIECYIRKQDTSAEPSAKNFKKGPSGSHLSDNRLVDSTRLRVPEGSKSSVLADSNDIACPLKACSYSDYSSNKLWEGALETKSNILAEPPLSFGERFEEAYEVILVLDSREQFATQGSRSRRIIENISEQFKIKIEVRRLPVGDAIWLARNKCIGTEYVLDFVVERKKVDDLRMSIRDNRYKDQKLRLLRCGLKKMIYLVEGDPNYSEAAESIKTACFTTEILEGFDVQRTSGLANTLKKYGYLTQAINQYYSSLDYEKKNPRICPPYDEFIGRCEDLDKLTVSDVFAVQLMQVPQVTEEIAIAVLDMYPTVLSLAHAYSLLGNDIHAQEEMLKKQSNNLISGAASKNIFQLIWGS